MILNKTSTNDTKEKIEVPSNLLGDKSGSINPTRFSWSATEEIEMGSSIQMIPMSQISTYITNILMETDRAFLKISVMRVPRFFEIKRMPIPSFDFFAFQYEPEMPSGVRCETLEQYLGLMFSRASSLSIIVREKSANKWEIACVDVEYKQTKRNPVS